MLNSRCKRIVQMITGRSPCLESSPNRRAASAPTGNGQRGTVNGQREKVNVAGFSLIEVLVATAILIMIVSMLGLTFRQSSMAWDSGIRRAEGISGVRAVVGAIERDLRAATDAREFGLTQEFSTSKLKFVALLEPETGEKNADQRIPTLITYEGGTSVQRTATRLTCNGGSWSTSGGTDTSTLLDSTGNEKVSIKFKVVKSDTASSDALPASVTISAELVSSDKFSGLSVRSYGPDGKPDTRDDILVE